MDDRWGQLHWAHKVIAAPWVVVFAIGVFILASPLVGWYVITGSPKGWPSDKPKA